MDDPLTKRLLEVAREQSPDLPMEVGAFYERYIYPAGRTTGSSVYDVTKSRFGNLSNWMRQLERAGIIQTTTIHNRMKMHKSVKIHAEARREFLRNQKPPVKRIRCIFQPCSVDTKDNESATHSKPSTKTNHEHKIDQEGAESPRVDMSNNGAADEREFQVEKENDGLEGSHHTLQKCEDVADTKGQVSASQAERAQVKRMDMMEQLPKQQAPGDMNCQSSSGMTTVPSTTSNNRECCSGLEKGETEIQPNNSQHCQYEQDDPVALPIDATPVSKRSVEEQLRTRLLEVADICRFHLPMDTSLFYQSYIRDHCNVRESSYHTVTAWLQAMEDQGLVVVTKQKQACRNYRKQATYKVVVAVGRQAVQHYENTQMDNRKHSPKQESHNPKLPESKENNNLSPNAWKGKGRNKQQETNKVAALDATDSDQQVNVSSEKIPSVSSAAVQDAATKHMDQALRDCIDNVSLSQQEEKFPMDVGTFYQHFVLSNGCQIKSSSFASLLEWLQSMQTEGRVLLKRQRGKSSTWSTVIVAAGRPAVERIQGRGPKVLTATEKARVAECGVSPNLPARPTNADLSVSTDAATHKTTMVQTTRHAKDRQKQRRITNQAIGAIMENKKNVIQRSHDGKKTVRDQTTGLVAVVSGGQKHRIVTAWKEDLPTTVHECLQQEWSSLSKRGESTKSLNETDDSRIVTVSETYERYHNLPKQSKKKEGALVRKGKRYRVKLLIVGLPEKLVPVIANRIRNQVGCPCSLRSLDYSNWYSTHPSTMEPLAKDGSPTIVLNVASEPKVISNVLKQVETFVPRLQRRYLRENLKRAQMGEPYVMELVQTMAASKEEHVPNDPNMSAENVRRELLELYNEHAPEKVNDVGVLLEKYRGQETKLLEAARRKYASESTLPCDWGAVDKKNVCDDETRDKEKWEEDDFFGDDDPGTHGGDAVPFPEQVLGEVHCLEEDISSYF